MRYKAILNSILLIPLLVMIESCMTPTPIADNPTTPSEESKGSTHPQEKPHPEVEVKFFYSQDGGTSFKPLKNTSQLYSGDRLKVKIIPKEDVFIKILLINNNTGKMQRLDRNYGLTELKTVKGKYLFPAEGSTLLDKTKAKETICVLAFANKKEAKSRDNCKHGNGNIVDKVSYQLN